MKVYIATQGEYSDYHIEQVFLDKEKANIYARMHDCEVEEYDAHDDAFEIPESLCLSVSSETALEVYDDKLETDAVQIHAVLAEGKPTSKTNFTAESFSRVYFTFNVTKTMDKDTDCDSAKASIMKIAHDAVAKIKYLFAIGAYDFTTQEGLDRMVAEQFNKEETT